VCVVIATRFLNDRHVWSLCYWSSRSQESEIFQNIADTLTYLHDSCVINDCAFYLPVALLTSFESLGTLVFVVFYRSFQEPDVVVGPVQPKLNHHLAAHSRAHRHNPISQLDLFLHPKKNKVYNCFPLQSSSTSFSRLWFSVEQTSSQVRSSSLPHTSTVYFGKK
jgi:hypothetical protein